MTENILEIKQLKVDINKKNQKPQPIIKTIDLTIPKGEIVGIVGESGSGKSMTMKGIMNILPENGSMSYESFYFDGKDQNNTKDKIPAAMIFQDPMTSLNPLRTIGYHLVEVVLRNNKLSKKEAEKLAIQELNKVGITLPEKRMKQYPHELSGGMRQRIMIAMALLAKPKLLIADEPTTALDVTIQAQILDLIRKLQQEEDLSVILVTHDFGIVAGMCQSIRVMYDGKIVEEGTIDEVFYEPAHSYTKELLKAIPTGEKNQVLYSLSDYKETSQERENAEMVNLSETHRVLSKRGEENV
ncbi:ABC transporter ATP-binding protein [Vagococcus fluvialis]|uniref:ABC transporter ATP-binding protein n=2 Tax=Vagococcus fluvialis TaxID=2738 RepID=A0A369ALP0_9ENTE|nr:ABC transporter ATP-binding protein [Vagococcus fluvialis]MBO0488502.1 ABC transporter ATP-binding protein [Vagococcus fluvialis]MCM2140202.1 ABC transporter ATP-binding protein [Vagococcus fluvialis]MDT2748051.1 ABC transporter ATP-binding protein [Vagococcus fluvialis]MDT2781844.1 ABC transporter ATP-binding protein [Vagococcus fluvialis]NKC60289.1 ABC transporter ATP-binding protein [Vagococcus fluvialis]